MGILPELLLYGGAELQDRLLLLMEDVWKKGKVVKDWQDAEIVPIPKKGDLRKCDNWRRISLLAVVGKVFAGILQDRLQVVAEKILRIPVWVLEGEGMCGHNFCSKAVG